MGTRSIIAEPYGDGFKGRYHHWDGYPSGLGHQLWELYHGHFARDTEAMVSYLITDEPQGWSTICGADFTLPKGWHDDHDPQGLCAVCGLEMWRHYRQYYKEDHNPTGVKPPKPDEIMQLGHSHEVIRVPQGPQSYTARGETSPDPDGYWLTSDGDDGGTEWAYVISTRSLFIFERRYGLPHDDQGHGTGMFGMGASDTEEGGYWAPVAEFPWDSDMPDWDQLDAGTPLVTKVSA